MTTITPPPRPRGRPRRAVSELPPRPGPAPWEVALERQRQALLSGMAMDRQRRGKRLLARMRAPPGAPHAVPPTDAARPCYDHSGRAEPWQRQWSVDRSGGPDSWLAFHCSGMAFRLAYRPETSPRLFLSLDRAGLSRDGDRRYVFERMELVGGREAGENWAEANYAALGFLNSSALLYDIVARCEEVAWRERRRCHDCRFDGDREQFLLRDSVWDAVAGHETLCVGCLENRLGRRLTPADFADAEVNVDSRRRSVRLLSRMLGVGEPAVEAEWAQRVPHFTPVAKKLRNSRGFERTMRAYFTARREAEQHGQEPPPRPEYVPLPRPAKSSQRL